MKKLLRISQAAALVTACAVSQSSLAGKLVDEAQLPSIDVVQSGPATLKLSGACTFSKHYTSVSLVSYLDLDNQQQMAIVSDEDDQLLLVLDYRTIAAYRAKYNSGKMQVNTALALARESARTLQELTGCSFATNDGGSDYAIFSSPSNKIRGTTSNPMNLLGENSRFKMQGVLYGNARCKGSFNEKGGCQRKKAALKFTAELN